MPADGGEEVLVTDDAALDWNPVWAPDGQSLYFASDRGGIMNFWRVPIDEVSGRVQGPAEAVTTPTRFAAHATLSADGQRLAFTAITRSQNVEQIDFDPEAGLFTGTPRPITSGTGVWSGQVSESPDGAWLALTSQSPQQDLYVTRSDGTGLPRRLTNDVAFDRSADWSPVSDRIAFQTNRSGSREIWVISSDGSGPAADHRGLGSARTRLVTGWRAPRGHRVRVVATGGDSRPDTAVWRTGHDHRVTA